MASTTLPLFLLLSTTLYHTTSAVEVSCPASCQSCDTERVMCQGASLTSVPTQLSPDTFMLDLTQNDITSLDGLSDLPNAQSLRMSSNKLTVIQDMAFEKVPQLMSLDLTMNKLTTVNEKAFEGLVNLMTMSLNMNKLSSIGAIFGPTNSLTSLRLAHNEITNIDEENFKNNPKIKMLDLSHNKIKSIHPDAFKTLDMLRYLILSNNPITTLSDLTITSTILSLVDFSNCMLTHVPRTMPPSLNDFRLGNNKITKIFQDDFKNITSLRILFLNDNEISDVEHRSFSDQENLRELWLSRNMLVYIPRGLPANLEKLQIDNNRVVELEQMLFKNGSKLTKLSLESNNVRKVHQDALKDVNDLNDLNLQGNEISLIDVGTFTKVPNLKVLKLTQNPIKIFESGAFENLDSLSEIYLSYIDYPVSGREELLSENLFTAMPNLTKIDLTSSVRLTKRLFELFEEKAPTVRDTVKTVILQYNELDTVPASVQAAFPNVENLILDGNPFTCDKRLLWLHTWMKDSPSVNFHSSEDLACDRPYSLKGKLLSEMQADEFVEESAVESEAPVLPDLPPFRGQPTSESSKPDIPDLFGGTRPSGGPTQPDTKPKINKQNPPSTEPAKPVEKETKVDKQKSQTTEVAQPDTQDAAKPDTSTQDVSKPKDNKNQPSQSRGPSRGTNVIIKGPSGETSDKQPLAKQPDKQASKPNKRGNKNKMDRAARKAARLAARKAARQAARAKKNKNKKGKKKNKKGKGGKKGNSDKRRKKRRIRGKGGKRCKKDQDGNMQCTKRKRCKVDDQGHVICRKRGGKNETKITPDILNKE